MVQCDKCDKEMKLDFKVTKTHKSVKALVERLTKQHGQDPSKVEGDMFKCECGRVCLANLEIEFDVDVEVPK